MEVEKIFAQFFSLLLYYETNNGIANGTVIHLVGRLRGGARTRRTARAIPYLMTETSSDEDSDEDSV